MEAEFGREAATMLSQPAITTSIADTSFSRPASPRLEYRPIEVADMPAIAALHADPRVAALLIDGVPDTMAKAFAFVRWNAPFVERGYGMFAVRRRSSDTLIGLFSLTPFDGDETLLELGGRLASSAWVGGLAIEAGAAMIEHAFGALGRERLVSAFHPEHRSAPAALARLGFVPAGSATLFGRVVATMELTRAAWQAQGRAPHHARQGDASRTDYGGVGPGRSYAAQHGRAAFGAETKEYAS
jgi:RimJ/RimL family protein N-acetyltransferase